MCISAFVVCLFHVHFVHPFNSKESQTFAVEDLDLNGIESLKGHQYLAIGKHLCGPATGEITLSNCNI